MLTSQSLKNLKISGHSFKIDEIMFFTMKYVFVDNLFYGMQWWMQTIQKLLEFSF